MSPIYHLKYCSTLETYRHTDILQDDDYHTQLLVTLYDLLQSWIGGGYLWTSTTN